MAKTKTDLCPHCGQNMTYRRRALNSGMARTLIRLRNWDNESPGQFVHVPTVLSGDNHEVSQLAWWGLVEERPDIKDDGNPHAGYWRITIKGRDFARNTLAVPSHAFTFNTRYQTVELDDSKLILISQVKRFNYDDLIMGW